MAANLDPKPKQDLDRFIFTRNGEKPPLFQVEWEVETRGKRRRVKLIVGRTVGLIILALLTRGVPFGEALAALRHLWP